MNVRVQYRGYDLDFPSYPSLEEILHSYENTRRQILLRIGKGEDQHLPVASRDGELPLSFIQESLWLQDQLYPGSSAYNLPAAVRLSGTLEIISLQKSISEVIRRHEILRTTFPSVDGRPWQSIGCSLPVQLPTIDLSGLYPSEQEGAVKRKISEEVRTPFDLQNGPVLRACLLKLAPEEHIVLVTVHHIVSDAWSAGILLRELATLYEAYSSGKSSPLPELSLQYADFAKWQRERLSSETLQRMLDSSKEQLAGCPAFLDFPTDFPRPPALDSNGAHHFFHFPVELTTKVRELANREGVTRFTLLLTAFQVLLAKYAGQEDIVVGTPVAGRTRVELESLIGCFINTLAVRTIAKGQLRFRELLRNVQNTMRKVSAYQELPFERLLEALAVTRNPAYTPLYQILFDFVNVPSQGEFQLSHLSMSSVATDTGATKMDLLIDMWEAGGELVGHIEYRTALFKAETIVTFARSFEALVSGIVADPDARINTLEVRTKDRKRQELGERISRAEENRQRLVSIRPRLSQL